MRVTGWPILDSRHIRKSLVLSTNRETHPVTKFEVCTTTRNDRVADQSRWVAPEDFRVWVTHEVGGRRTFQPPPSDLVRLTLSPQRVLRTWATAKMQSPPAVYLTT